MSKKHKYTYNDDISSQELASMVLDDFMQTIEHDSVKDLLAKLPTLRDNRKAMCIHGMDYLGAQSISKYKLYGKFIMKYNPKLKNCVRNLGDYEYGNRAHITANVDDKIVELNKFGLDYGVYLTQLDDDTYSLFNVMRNNDDEEYRISYDIWFFGDKYKKYYKKFYKMYAKYKEYGKTSLPEVINYTNGKEPTDTIFKPFDKVVFAKKKEVLGYIDNFIKNIPNYHKYGVTPKLSIMIYGEPGTGKSTFAKALAKYMKIRSVMSVSPDYFGRPDSRTDNNNGYGRFVKYMRNPDSVWVLDDCDCICKNRETDTSSGNAKILANLLEFLDNPPTIEYDPGDGKFYPISIVVATTNYYDKLDPAVKRYGRFDLTIEMKEFNKAEAEEMCSIYDMKLSDIVKDQNINAKSFRISPSKLQAMCLENLDNQMKSVNN